MILLTPKEAASYLKMSESMLAKMRMTGGDTPRFIKFGRSVRYNLATLDAWLQNRERAHTSEAA